MIRDVTKRWDKDGVAPGLFVVRSSEPERFDRIRIGVGGREEIERVMSELEPSGVLDQAWALEGWSHAAMVDAEHCLRRALLIRHGRVEADDLFEVGGGQSLKKVYAEVEADLQKLPPLRS